MSFSKNPPWLATSSAVTPPGLQALGLANPMVNFQATGQPVFSQSGITIASQPQAPPPPNISSLSTVIQQQPAPHSLYTHTVSYPAPRPMNTIAYPQAPTHQLQPLHPPQQQQQQQPPQMSPQMGLQMPTVVSCPTVVQSNIMATQRAYHGTVTKIQGDVGFIDDEIFFHKSVVFKGCMPKVGELVFVEASFAANTPFKWNASRVQLMERQGQAPNNKSNNYNNHNSSSSSSNNNPENGNINNYGRNSGNNRHQSSSTHRSPRRSLDRSTSKRDTGRDSSVEHDRRRRPVRDDRDTKRERRDYTPPSNANNSSDRGRNSNSSRALVSSSGGGSVRASPSPPKKRRRVVPRYMVQIPKVNLKLTAADIWDLKQRYQNLYIPSDFFHSSIRWTEMFTADNPFVLRQPCAFQIMHKEIATPPEMARDESLLEPPDADYSFSARVMLMSVPPNEIYKQCFATADEEEDVDRNLVHPSRTISFLVGQRNGKNETMAIGGPWSPSLDGKNPESDPTVLIRTAIRTCKALTGIDLSRCTQWYRFVELYYHRRETGRVNTVVVYLPDVRSCIPTAEEWLVLKGQYKMALQRVLDQNDNSSKASNSNADSSDQKTTPEKDTSNNTEMIIETPAVVPEMEQAPPTDGETEQGKDVAMEAEQETEKQTPVQPEDEKMEIAVDDKAENTTAETAVDGTVNEDQQQLDPKAMKMPELKEALSARNLPIKGLKADLVERLTDALKKETNDIVTTTEPEQKSQILATEESNQSEEGEPDLANMIVIDELCPDTVKQPQPPQKMETSPEINEIKSKEAVIAKTESTANSTKEVKKLSDKDIRQLQRRYTLPDTPEIIVHPSKTAKGGKFDCNILTLSVLLDYGLDDSKEHSFEVFLFAELFNEMLMRDFGYNIYKALYALPEKKEEEEKEAKENKKDVKDSKSTESSENNNKKDDRKRDDASKDDQSSSADAQLKKRERKKQITINPELLLSFAYFDQTLCGYVLCKDLEDLLSTIGLSLSKSQIRKVVKKGAVTDSLYYRKLTDKDEDQVNITISDTKETDAAIIAKGNATLLPVFNEAKNEIDKVASSKPTETTTGGDSETGLVMYNGALVNVEKLMERIKTAEKALLDTEQVLADVKKENKELSAANNKSSTKIKDLAADLKLVTRKLGDAESSTSSLQRKTSEYLSVMSAIQDKIAPILVKKEKHSSGSSSRNSEREKDKDRETKVEVKQESSRPKVSTSTPAEESIKKEK